jgi:hypothetical protein
MKNCFGRLGTKEDLDKQIKFAQDTCKNFDKECKVIRDTEAETVKVEMEGTTLFTAISKGYDAWIIMYNKEYYQP